jgi:hypothetical protein
MKIGVSTIPCRVVNRPLRALEDASVLSSSKDIVNPALKLVSAAVQLRKQQPLGEIDFLNVVLAKLCSASEFAE